MDDDDKSKKSEWGTVLPLPDEAADKKPAQPSESSDAAAADLIRKKVKAAYEAEPPAAEEALDVAEMGVRAKLSRHQRFIQELTTSGKSMENIQMEWHDYYAGLTDAQKHEVWQEFYKAQALSAESVAPVQSLAPHEKTEVLKLAAKPKAPPSGPVMQTIADLQKNILGSGGPKLKGQQHLQSLLFGLGMGAIVVLIFMFSFFNERFIAPFIQPSRTATNTPIIADSNVAGSNPEVIIPKINVEIPVVYNVSTIDEAAVENALQDGVVHYADTSVPGQDGHAVFVGHSSNNILNKGKYKFAFVLLHQLQNGDLFYLQKDGKRYTYQVYKREIVKPTDVSVLGAEDKTATASLITCDPPGTSNNRLVVTGVQISPDPSSNIAASTASDSLATKAAIIPGNSPTLWSKVVQWFKG